MKKLLLFLMVTVMALSAVTLTACTKKGDNSTPASSTPTSTNPGGNSDQTQTYTATFYVNDDVYYQVEFERGNTIPAPTTDPTLDGYDFIGWSGYSATRKYTSSKTFTAQFEKRFVFPTAPTTYQTPVELERAPGYSVNKYEAKQTSANIVVDGDLDDAYLAATAIKIETPVMNNAYAKSTGYAYIIWDANFIYVFVVVNDANIVTFTSGDSWKYDGVEFVLDTWNKATRRDVRMGTDDNYRPEDYCGEGQFRVNAGKSSLATDSIGHWLETNPDVQKSGASKMKEGVGYTAEFKVAWGDFGKNGGATAGKQVAFGLTINDAAGSDGTRGVVAVDSYMDRAYDWAGALAALDLIA